MTSRCIRTLSSMRSGFFSALAVLLLMASAGTQAQYGPDSSLNVPYVPTPMPVVQRMLELGEVDSNDVIYDLGSGDGRIVVTAARERGARGVGIDLDPQRVKEANANASQAGVTDKVRFVQGDLFKTDFSEATVVTLYLLEDINRKLRPQLWRQLKPGTKVVSHSFTMGPEWPPEKSVMVQGATIFVWTVTPEIKASLK